MKVELSHKKNYEADFPEDMKVGDEIFLIDLKTGQKIGNGKDKKGNLKPYIVTKIL